MILVNHFSQEHGIRGFFERRLAPLANSIGWHAVFDLDRVLVCDDLRLAERRSLMPFGLFTMLRFVKQPGYGFAREHAHEMARVGRARALVPARIEGRNRSGRGSNGPSAAPSCTRAVCLTPAIGAPYIADFPAKWRSSSAG